MLPNATGTLEQAQGFLKRGTDALDPVTGGLLDSGFSNLIRAINTVIGEVEKLQTEIEQLKASS
jgi:hypothetical protein